MGKNSYNKNSYSNNFPAARRAERFNRMLREEVSRLLAKDIRDPRISEIVIVDVDTSDDLHHSDIYYTCHDMSKQNLKELQTGLEKATGFLRGRLSKVLSIRYAPHLKFKYDKSVAYGARINTLLNGLEIEEKDDETS